jgi:eukaryotic-like serine/threonine-protein kinase
VSGQEPLSEDDPQAIGPYRLTARLGSGGQGQVYLGLQPDGEPVAIKIIYRGFDNEPTKIRFLREVEAARKVAPFCIAAVLTTGTHEGRPYIVSEYIAGPSMRELIEREGPRTPSQLERLAVGTITALAAIHQAGIVHRDLKPGNVILGHDGPRVVDFGIARAEDDQLNSRSGVFGTPSFMSPEQVGGARVGPASDVFSWAGTMFYAATGDAPFTGPNPLAVMNQVLTTVPQVGRVPPSLAIVLKRCFERDPALRPGSAEVLMTLLGNRSGAADEDWAHSESVVVMRAGAAVAAAESTGRTIPAPSRRQVLVGGGGFALAGIGGLAVTLALRGGASGATILKGHTTGVTALDFADLGDRTLLLSGSSDRTVRLWDPGKGTQVGGELRGHTGWVGAVRYFPLDGAPYAVSTSEDRTLRIWNLTDRREVAKLTGHTDWVGAVALNALGGVPVAVSAGGDRTVRVWDLVAHRPVGSVIRGHTNVVGALAIGSLHDRQVIISGDGNGRIRLWDLETHRPIGGELKGHIGQVDAIAYTELNGRPTAVSVGTDRLLHVWDLIDRRHTAYPGHTDRVHAVVTADLEGVKSAITVSNDLTLRVWDPATGKILHQEVVSTGIPWVVTAGTLGGETIAAVGGMDSFIRLRKQL